MTDTATKINAASVSACLRAAGVRTGLRYTQTGYTDSKGNRYTGDGVMVSRMRSHRYDGDVDSAGVDVYLIVNGDVSTPPAEFADQVEGALSSAGYRFTANASRSRFRLDDDAQAPAGTATRTLDVTVTVEAPPDMTDHDVMDVIAFHLDLSSLTMDDVDVSAVKIVRATAHADTGARQFSRAATNAEQSRDLVRLNITASTVRVGDIIEQGWPSDDGEGLWKVTWFTRYPEGPGHIGVRCGRTSYHPLPLDHALTVLR